MSNIDLAENQRIRAQERTYVHMHENFCMLGAASAQVIICLESLARMIATFNRNYVCKL